MANIMKRVFALCFVGLILFSTCGFVSSEPYYDHIINDEGRTLYAVGDLNGIYVAGDIPADVSADDVGGICGPRYDHEIVDENGETRYVLGDLDGIHAVGDIPADVCADDYKGDGTENIGSPDVGETCNDGDLSAESVGDDACEEVATEDCDTEDVPEDVDNDNDNNTFANGIVNSLLNVLNMIGYVLRSLFFI